LKHPLIKQNISRILGELPEGVRLVAAAKGVAPAEIIEAMEAGVRVIGENYIQETETAYKLVGNRAQWHFIGHLQRNKVKKAVAIFDMIETVDSASLAREIDRSCANIGKVMPVLIEINSGREKQKAGVLPEEAEGLRREIAGLKNIGVVGLMTMGPRFGDPEDSRTYFAETRRVFEAIKALGIPDIEMKYLSMGMSNTYRVALQEGANIVRIGSKIFGERG